RDMPVIAEALDVEPEVGLTAAYLLPGLRAAVDHVGGDQGTERLPVPGLRRGPVGRDHLMRLGHNRHATRRVRHRPRLLPGKPAEYPGEPEMPAHLRRTQRLCHGGTIARLAPAAVGAAAAARRATGSAARVPVR